MAPKWLYAIRFDFPGGQHPLFAATAADQAGFTRYKLHAELFTTEEAAQQALALGYGDGTRPHGRVVAV